MGKVFVDVLVKYTKEGEKIPLTVIWADGRRYDIDKITDIRRAASLKAGGQGMRYCCRIKGRDTYMWLEDGRWFVETDRAANDKSPTNSDGSLNEKGKGKSKLL